MESGFSERLPWLACCEGEGAPRLPSTVRRHAVNSISSTVLGVRFDKQRSV